ncbi:MAG: bifunctional molybdenum cofactor biosynthesis protein MoaC/MoaB [Thermomonas sp.]|nr:bifunctional molybdenum cofactor biosynthesis protein MoaC/MoaB [Thermomonas sp.]MBK6415678.1 bifunctional molybdenum cofactor biosynthesis protein MoaC/MoaB [Thermomonas sp.]MBK6924837.1 bifunctional molybdenum cofactor biosynthesis protein MoaC/MoaB [Thermomonas sp.]MBK9670317.1 bifunctional molybdenum cofactor biosynthesis protein MoaC/MoaB [Thermomonas sp.]MBP6439693.1 bifunctional molybdenum cofactor biosynthesis protein MoaC/MoaB [Thermomonas sp.]
MADVRRKRPSERRAVAVGELRAGPVGFAALAGKTLPKGDALAMAEVAGLQGAKNAAQLMPLCHPLSLEYVDVRCVPVPERHAIRVYCETSLTAKTGVEMEALAGASAALLTLYDLTKPVEPALSIEAVRLLFKEGGKKGLWIHPEGMDAEERAYYRPQPGPRLDGEAVAVVTLSDRAAAGVYEDKSGALLEERLRAMGADVHRQLLADGIEPLAAALRAEAARGTPLVLCTGGTGFGPRDLAPEALAQVATRPVPGLAELFRSASSAHTTLAWLSRSACALVGDGTLVLLLPGSPKAVAQGMDILGPLLPHALAMMRGLPHA